MIQLNSYLTERHHSPLGQNQTRMDYLQCFNGTEECNALNFVNELNGRLRNQTCPSTLLELSARTVSKHLPFSYVRRNYLNLPELVAKRIMFWSFPTSSKHILSYHVHVDGCEFIKHTNRLRATVKQIVQIGFCVVGIVLSLDKEFYVTLTFDRCVITSVQCSCREETLLWCIHATILALHRFLYRDDVEIYMPISSSLKQLDRNQLQKLLQYLLSNCHDRVLEIIPDVQRKKYWCSEENSGRVQDNSEFAGIRNNPSWFFNSRVTGTKMVQYFCHRIYYELMRKAAQMVFFNDCNGLKILEMLMLRLLAKAVNGTFRFSVFDDKLINLWTFTLASPHVFKEEKEKFCSLIDSLAITRKLDVPNSVKYVKTNGLSSSGDSFLLPLNIEIDRVNLFLMPLCAGYMSWDDHQLQCILSSKHINLMEGLQVDAHQEYIWREHLPTSCVRVRALQMTGYHLEALRLSVAIALAIKDQSKRWKKRWEEIQLLLDVKKINEEMAKDLIHAVDSDWMSISLITHRVNPLEILCDSLFNASQIKMDATLTPIHYFWYRQLAVEAIIIILSQELMTDEVSWEDDRRDTVKLMNIVCTNLQIRTIGLPGVSFLEIKDVIKTLLQAGIFTSCGNFSSFSHPRYYWCLLMTKIIIDFDKDFAAEFAVACLQFQNRSNLSKVSPSQSLDDDYYCTKRNKWNSDIDSLLLFIISTFSEKNAENILDRLLKLEGFPPITNLILYLTETEESKVIIKFLFNWLLKKLHLTLYVEREINGIEILTIASYISFAQTVHFLRNWEKYVRISESAELISLFCFPDKGSYDLLVQQDYYKFSTDQNTILKEEGYKLALRFTESNENKELVFKYLRTSFCFRIDLYFTEEQQNTLNCNVFKIGLCCVETNPREFLLKLLLDLVIDENRFSAYYQSLLEALQQNKIVLKDILVIDEVTRVTSVRYCFKKIMEISKYCMFMMEKLSVKYCKIPINYMYRGSQKAKVINHFIDVAKLADEVSEAEAIQVTSFIIENVKSTPVLHEILKKFYEFWVKEERKPDWLKKLLEKGVQTLEIDTYRWIRRSKNRKANHYKRIAELRNMFEQC